jgi:hypothetical protein
MATVHPATQAAHLGRFRVGRVLARSVSSYLRNILWVSPISFCLLLIYEGIVLLFQKYIATTTAPDARGFVAIGFLIALVITYFLCASFVIQGTLQHLRDGRVRIGQVFVQGLVRAPLVILIGSLIQILVFVITVFLAGFLGAATGAFMSLPRDFPRDIVSNPLPYWPFAVSMFLAILPGLYLSTIWNVGTAASVAEQLGFMGALGRSRRMTKGFRWRVLAILLGCLVLSFLPSALTIAVGPSVVALTWPGWIAHHTFLVAIFGLLMIIPAVTFVELRQAKEGKEIQSLSGIFE